MGVAAVVDFDAVWPDWKGDDQQQAEAALAEAAQVAGAALGRAAETVLLTGAPRVRAPARGSCHTRAPPIRRNLDEIVRVFDALELSSEYSVSTPVNWNPFVNWGDLLRFESTDVEAWIADQVTATPSPGWVRYRSMTAHAGSQGRHSVRLPLRPPLTRSSRYLMYRDGTAMSGQKLHFGSVRRLASGPWKARYNDLDGRRRTGDVKFESRANRSARNESVGCAAEPVRAAIL